MESNEIVVARVLAGQADGYLIAPEAAAFVAQGMDGDTVRAALGSLRDAGFVEESRVEEEVEVRKHTQGGDGQPIVDVEYVTELRDFGWRITDKGRMALEKAGG